MTPQHSCWITRPEPHHSFQSGAEAGADGFVQRGVFDEVLLGGEFGGPDVEDGLVRHKFIPSVFDEVRSSMFEIYLTNVREALLFLQ